MKSGFGLVAIVPALLAGQAPAQDSSMNWPTRPVKIVVPSSPGGGTDIFARLLASGLTDALQQQFVVENRPGASGNIGAAVAAKAAPDGYTILVSANPAIVINPNMYKDLPYNAERDFIPVARGVISPLVYLVHPSAPVRTLAELVELGRKEPGKITYGSAGVGSTTYLGVRLLEWTTGAKFTHIPYKGLAHASQDLLSGQINFMLSDVVTLLTQIRAGKIIALAITHRTSQLPGVPTLAEAGFPNLEVNASFMVVAPARTPVAIVERLNTEINKVMKTPAVAEKLAAQVLIPFFETREEFAATLKREREMWANAIRDMGIRPEL
jgi:tripartite-type tricarboxylate transporter receptor subunit TctC